MDSEVNEFNNIEKEAWKDRLEKKFYTWMNDLSQLPQIAPQSEEPDLYSFFKELSALRNEIRKGGRRSHEVLERFGESLSSFHEAVDKIQNRLLELNQDNEKRSSSAKKELLLPLLGIFERLGRLSLALNSRPEKRFFIHSRNWEKFWDNYNEGYKITFSHLKDILDKMGVQQIETKGTLFDPMTMIAIALEHNTRQPSNYVVEELSPGFYLDGEILKLAEVKISKNQ